MKSYNEKVRLEFKRGISLFVKREDKLHPEVSGNKFRKLKYNLMRAQESGFETLLTFGGAFSNHIAATAAAGKLYGFKTIGVIRGEELADKVMTNPTLSFAVNQGMKLHFLSREDYARKDTAAVLELLNDVYGEFYLLPEGGSNNWAVKGCEEILTVEDNRFDFICCASGTGATAAGIINATNENQTVLVFPALKGSFLSDDIRKFAKKDNWFLIESYHFGGYGKINVDLVRFLNEFYVKTQIPLDPVYTGKMMYGVLDLIEKDYFLPNTNILCIHTGGLQGVAGMNQWLEKKNMPIINY